MIDCPETCSPALRRKVLGDSNRLVKKKSLMKRTVKAVKKATTRRKGSNGSGSSYASLDSDGGSTWLHSDHVIADGVAFEVDYLGTSVLDKVVDAGAESQRIAMKVARSFPLIEADGSASLGGKKMSLEFQRKEVKLEVSDSMLSVSDESTGSGNILFRHSTARVAFSTVDPENPTRFFYVALSKVPNSTARMFHIHMFQAKCEKQGFEITFTCAQAFDSYFQAQDESAAENQPAEDTSIDAPVTWTPNNTSRA